MTKLATKKYPLKVFYPSTILIDEPLNRFGIYTKVKLRAEKIIDKFEKKNIKIIYLRLPKIGTDQNLSIEPQEYCG